MSDEVTKKLWKIKDGIAEQFGSDPAALVAYLRAKKPAEGQRIADLRKLRRSSRRDSQADDSNL